MKQRGACWVNPRNEDLVPSRINLKGGLLENVGGFLGISPQKFDPDTYSQAQVKESFLGCKGMASLAKSRSCPVHSRACHGCPPVEIMNCNNKKGFKSKCDNLTTAYKAVRGKSQQSFGDPWLLGDISIPQP